MINDQNQDLIDLNKKRDEVKDILSEYLGVGADDIHSDDSLREDLHMSSSDLTDFVHALSEKGYEIDLSEFTTIETVEELLDKIIQEEI